MSEDGDYTPASWSSGVNFTDARRTYDDHVRRSYNDAVSSGKTQAEILLAKISTLSNWPLILVPDVTGSMGERPGVMFGKWGYAHHELRTEYLGEKGQMAFVAVGDANSDKYPVQPVNFVDLDEGIKDAMLKMIIEKGGGGNLHESYELALLYILHNCEMPNADRATIIILGDEMPYDRINAEQARRVTGVDIKESISTAKLFKDLQKKFSVYFIHMPYNGRGGFQSMSDETRQVQEAWVKLLGEDRVAQLEDPQRIVDVIFGLLARDADKIDYYYDELTGRQKDKNGNPEYDKINAAKVSLTSIHAEHFKKKDSNPSGHSHSVIPIGGKRMKKLLVDD